MEADRQTDEKTHEWTDRHTDGQTDTWMDRQTDRQTVAHLKMLWGDLGGQGGGAQASGGHLVKHFSDEPAVLGILFFVCLFASLLLILTAPAFENAPVMSTCISMRSLIQIKLMLLQT